MRQAREVVEEYRPGKVLKTSPWSTVFLAVDPNIGDPVALKLIACGGPIAGDHEIERFFGVVGAAQKLPGSAMPKIRDYGITPDQSAFLVTDLTEGVSLDNWRSPSAERAISVLLQLLGALDVFAGAGIAHLNLLTENVLISGNEKSDQLQLLGFGTAAFLTSVAAGIWPDSLAPEVPPELFQNQPQSIALDWHADLFSFAVIACQMLGAEIEGLGSGRTTVSIGPSALQGLGDAADLASSLGKALDFDPQKRGQSTAGIRDALIMSLPMGPMTSEPKASIGGEERSPYQTFRAEPGEVPKVRTSSPPKVPHKSEKNRREDAGPTLNGSLTPAAASAPPPAPPAQKTRSKTAAPPRKGPSSPDPKLVAVASGKKVAGSSGRPRTPPRTFLLAAAAVVSVILLLITSAVMMKPDGSAAPVEPMVEQAEPVLTIVPTPRTETLQVETSTPVDVRLEDAQLLNLEGNLEDAKEAIGVFSADEVDQFSEEEREIYDAIAGAAAGADRDRAIRDLSGGLKTGSIRMLRRGVAVVSNMSRNEIEAVPGLASALNEGREALKIHSEILKAKNSGDHIRVLELSSVLETALPEFSGTFQLREAAVRTLVAEAEAVIKTGDYSKAIAQLEELQRLRPDRRELAERISWCRGQIVTDNRYQGALDSALARGNAGDPEYGLRLLAEEKPPASWKDRFTEAQNRLRSQLAEQDAGYPKIELQEGFELAFKKNKTLVVPLRVTDDYRVNRVVVLVKTAASTDYREIPLKDSGNDLYQFRVAPELHGNEQVEFFVVATDLTGHETRLGGPDGPLTIRKLKWFKK